MIDESHSQVVKSNGAISPKCLNLTSGELNFTINYLFSNVTWCSLKKKKKKLNKRVFHSNCYVLVATTLALVQNSETRTSYHLAVKLRTCKIITAYGFIKRSEGLFKNFL